MTGAIIILYNPDIASLEQALDTLLPQVDEVCLIDNSDTSMAARFEKREGVVYMPLLQNMGIAAAQNRGIRHFQEKGYDYVLFCDQDSQGTDHLVERLITVCKTLEEEGQQIAAIGPTPVNGRTGRSYYNKPKNIVEQFVVDADGETWHVDMMHSIVSSFSLVRLSAFNEAGLFEEPLFIDAVDNEWCWRAAHFHGLASFVVRELSFHHMLGQPTKLPVKKSAPARLYYQYRNFLVLLRRPYVPAFWKRHCAWTYLMKLFFYPLFVSPRLHNLRQILRGIRDGLFRSWPSPFSPVLSRKSLYHSDHPRRSLKYTLARLLAFLPDGLMLRLQYFVKLRRWPNLRNPQRFSEKMQCYKAHCHLPQMLACTDKYKVRAYIYNQLGTDRYLNTLYQVCERAEDIRFDELPEQFVIKTTDGGNGDNILICTDKNRLDIGKTVATVNSWKGKRLDILSREWAYQGARESRIIVERLLSDSNNEDGSIDDYKFLCFDGVFQYLWVDRGRYTNHRRGFWNKELKFLNDVVSDHPTFAGDEVPVLPANIQEMIALAEKLAQGFPFVRVDLYNIQGEIVFGEMTFYPWSGYVRFHPDSFDYELGNLLHLSPLASHPSPLVSSPTVSILMSVYAKDNPAYLDEAIASIWTEQTRRPDQIVLIKDGPLTAEVEEVVKKWQQEIGSVLEVYANEENRGLTYSLNRGLGKVTGDLIARMDSDDRSHPQRLERQLRYMLEHPEIDILGGSMQEFDEHSECLNVRHYPTTPQEARATIHRASPVAHPTVMMRRHIFDQGLRYDERYRISQDIALWFDALCAGYTISNLTEITLFFRRANDVYKRRGRMKAWNEFKIYMRGVWRMYGLFTFKYIYPIMRLGFRLMPESIVRWGYDSRLRHRIAEKK